MAGGGTRVDIPVIAGLVVILAVVLAGPFLVRRIEENLEAFLLACGVAALTVANFASIEGVPTGWSAGIVEEALTAPVFIGSLLGIPVGIAQIVLLVGFLIYLGHRPLEQGVQRVVDAVPLPALAFLLVVALALLSSVISAILSAILLIEILCALPLSRVPKVRLAVVACFAIGLGAALTPLGEPLSTIAISKLSGPPYSAGFDFLMGLLGIYILPGILAFGILAVFAVRDPKGGREPLLCRVERGSPREVVLRAAKVYLFIMALVFLGEGFKPLILGFVAGIPADRLFWVNMVSAALDNATLTAAEIGPYLSEIQIRAALMGLLISGGMLIPGNIPNIITAGKLGITSSEWGRVGVPLGLAVMGAYFVILFLPAL
jgi:predicted cation transporter